jgi:hypothetical protein
MSTSTRHHQQQLFDLVDVHMVDKCALDCVFGFDLHTTSMPAKVRATSFSCRWRGIFLLFYIIDSPSAFYHIFFLFILFHAPFSCSFIISLFMPLFLSCVLFFH